MFRLAPLLVVLALPWLAPSTASAWADASVRSARARVELEDGIRVVPRPLHGGTWHAHHDHRMATTGALIGLAVPDVLVDDIATTAKTMPEFPQIWAGMLGEDEPRRPHSEETMRAS